MKIKGKTGLGNILKILLQFCFIVGIVFLLCLYPIASILHLHFNGFILCIYPCGIGFLCLIYQFIGMFNSLKDSNPFCLTNVKRMTTGMFTSIIIALFVGIALILTIFVYDYYTLQLQVALLFITLLFIGVAIALYILKELFQEAISYKEENDLTI